jgi:hypothetical protein
MRHEARTIGGCIWAAFIQRQRKYTYISINTTSLGCNIRFFMPTRHEITQTAS